MLQLCSYETHALGYSAFCNLFTEEDFINYEYYYDLVSHLCLTPNLLLSILTNNYSHSTTTTAQDLQLPLRRAKPISRNS